MTGLIFIYILIIYLAIAVLVHAMALVAEWRDLETCSPRLRKDLRAGTIFTSAILGLFWPIGLIMLWCEGQLGAGFMFWPPKEPQEKHHA